MELPDAEGVRVIFLHDPVDDGLILFRFRTVNDVVVLEANQRAICGNGDDIEVVNFCELRGFGFSRSGHARKLLVHAEIILESDGRERLIFALDFHAFFGFDGLVQSIGPAASGHLACR